MVNLIVLALQFLSLFVGQDKNKYEDLFYFIRTDPSILKEINKQYSEKNFSEYKREFYISDTIYFINGHPFYSSIPKEKQEKLDREELTYKKEINSDLTKLKEKHSVNFPRLGLFFSPMHDDFIIVEILPILNNNLSYNNNISFNKGIRLYIEFKENKICNVYKKVILYD